MASVSLMAPALSATLAVAENTRRKSIPKKEIADACSSPPGCGPCDVPHSSDFDWPFDLSIDIKKSGKPRIAFLSGEERKYYHENPGHSKVGVMFSLNQHKGDTPNPTYIPPPLDDLQKPISRKGYGGSEDFLLRVSQSTWLASMRNHRIQRQCYVTFGSFARSPRLELNLMHRRPGPGTYSFVRPPAVVKARESFGGRKCIVPTVVTVCRYPDGEQCNECGQEQLCDYYRTTKPIYPGSQEHEVLCRACYCLKWNGHNEGWNRKQLANSFQKARHCNYKHDHQGLPNPITKASAKDIGRLTRKEVLLAKYFKDSCPPEVKLAEIYK